MGSAGHLVLGGRASGGCLDVSVSVFHGVYRRQFAPKCWPLIRAIPSGCTATRAVSPCPTQGALATRNPTQRVPQFHAGEAAALALARDELVAAP
jgi:hypothetical protein